MLARQHDALYRLRQQDGDPRITDRVGWQPPASSYRVTLLPAELDYRVLYTALHALAIDLPADASGVVFDFSGVTRLGGPWGCHFAMLMVFARDRDLTVLLDGLAGQPRALADLFFHSGSLGRRLLIV